MQRAVFVLVGLLFLLALGGCTNQDDTPVGAVQSYLNARIKSDEAKMLALSCKERESEVKSDADSFRSMNAIIDGLSCQQGGDETPYTLVSCQGKIKWDYAGEARNLDLGGRSFRTLKEDGKWKMCGFKGS